MTFSAKNVGDSNITHPIGYASALKQHTEIWIKKLYIHQKYQRCGIGTALMQTAITSLQPADTVNLLVNNNNSPAQQYYESRGFKKTGEIPVQMGDHHFIDYTYSCATNTLLKE